MLRLRAVAIRTQLGRLSRLATFGFVILFLLAFGLVRLGVAAADDSLLQLGRHLSAVGELGLRGGGRGVVINGQVLGLRVQTTETPPSVVLDHFEAWCRNGRSAFQDSLAVVDDLRTSAVGDASWRDLTMRHEDGDRGFVACVKTGARRPDLGELQARVRKMAQSGNLGELGRFHYVFVEPGIETTRVVAVWTEGDFFPGELFPADGDAPGTDVVGVPRPPTGRRLMSAGELGHPYGFTSYVEGSNATSELVGFYRQELPRNGWTILADTSLDHQAHSLAAERRGRIVILAMGLDDDGKSYVSIAEADD